MQTGTTRKPTLGPKGETFKRTLILSNNSAKPTEVKKHREEVSRIFSEWVDKTTRVEGITISHETINNHKYTLNIRIYRPEQKPDNDNKWPAIVFLPGGGLVLDSQIIHDTSCALMSKEANSAVISIQPPLAPEHSYKDILTTSYDATKQIFSSSKKYSIDTSNIVISGYSMGGNLAAQIAYLAQNDPNLNIAGLLLISSRLDCSGSQFENPNYNKGADLDFMSNDKSRTMYMNWCFPDKNADELKNPEFSPLYVDDFDASLPTVLIGGDCDSLIPDMRAFAAKRDLELTELPGLIHSSFLLNHLMPDSEHPAIVAGRKAKTNLFRPTISNNI